MTQRKRFEATYDDGDEDRNPGWRVVEWTNINRANGSATGRTAVRYCLDENVAKFHADRLNAEYYAAKNKLLIKKHPKT